MSAQPWTKYMYSGTSIMDTPRHRQPPCNGHTVVPTDFAIHVEYFQPPRYRHLYTTDNGLSPEMR